VPIDVKLLGHTGGSRHAAIAFDPNGEASGEAGIVGRDNVSILLDFQDFV
jgi:hypothetical protein